ncbi:MAG: ECF transporter S component [Clostridiales bacterium]|jgi:uncharacterized membrane protein|nr:ECF transporter S component [Clostridiales bacterium]HOA34387.1 ECF transporter S component [Clostridiales bacterium]HOJ35872.1 ECF transporter S component [Clostridiales bacterium]HPP68460.1 ECF transporter S component [Clostridiales bacterium]HPU67050.1 ECF transporter S component [Clostridiales bacterium]
MKNKNKLFYLVATSIISAVVLAMTFIPNTGYITIIPNSIEITTLHIIVCIGAFALGPKYGAVIGAVWGISNMLRAFTSPLFILFTNPLISVVPRILVGLFAGLVSSALLKRTKLPLTVVGVITAIVGTLTNTVLVLSALHIFGDMLESYKEMYKIFQSIISTIISVNATIEIVAAIIIVPAVGVAIFKAMKNYGIEIKRKA